MKKILLATLVIVTILATSNTGKAQAWEKSTKVLGIGFGASNFFYIDNYYRNYTGWKYGRFYSPLTGQFNFQGEFGVHDYVGIGFTTGIGGGGNRGRWGGYYAGTMNIPVGVIANFHFYQLIQDKTGKNIHADKLDIYGGVSLGSGVAFIFDPDDNHLAPIAFGGPHVGVRYYFTDKFGVNGEVGWGKSIVNAGLVFKL